MGRDVSRNVQFVGMSRRVPATPETRLDPCQDILDWLTVSALRFSEAFLESRRIVDALSGEITAIVPGKDYAAAFQNLADAQRRSAPPPAGENLNHALITLFETYARFAADAAPRLPPAGHAEPAWIRDRLEELDQLERAAETATTALVEVCGLEDTTPPQATSPSPIAMGRVPSGWRLG
jgi:hypothetical protein